MVDEVNGSSLLYVPRALRKPEAGEDASGKRSISDDAIRRLQGRLTELRRSLLRLRRLGESTVLTPGRNLAARASSSASVGLAFETSYTSLRSVEEVNAVPTSFSPRGPAFDGFTTSLPSVGGVYDGAQGDDTLTFELRDSRGVGLPGRLRVEMRDGADQKIDEVDFDSLPVGTPLAFSNGLTLSLGAGFAVKNSAFQLTVSTSTPSAVDPDGAFDGTRNDHPEFEDGLPIVAGSFRVNGETIAVQSDDTLNAVVDRITASGAGVTASFDVDEEKVVLVQDTPGPQSSVVVDQDTSGFLAASKLSTAVATIPEFTTRASSEPVNAVPTSYGPFEPVVSGASTAQPILTGTYDGAQGNDTLTFEFRDDGTIGDDDNLKIEVRDGNDDEIDELNFRNLPPGTPLTLTNGLKLQLSAGDVEKDDSFTVDVSISTPSAVDPDAAFDIVGNGRPDFEDGLPVTAGSFEVNGTSVAVLANDTINSVAARITATVDDVSASFDAATETLRLVRDTAGSFLGISLANDTSGFVAATKLVGTSSAGGQGHDGDRIISSVVALSGIGTGTFGVNQETLNVDVDADTLNDVVARINAADAGAIASFDTASNAFRIASEEPSEDLSLDDGTSGFFSGLQTAPGAYPYDVASPRTSFRQERDVIREIRETRRALDDLFRETLPGVDDALAEGVRDGLRDAITRVFTGSSTRASSGLRSRFGVDFDFRNGSRAVLRFDAERFERAARERFDETESFLFGASRGGGSGLVSEMLDEIDRIQKTLVTALDAPTGTSVDLEA